MFIIAGKFHHHKIMAPKGNTTRPTSSKLREALFNIIQNEIEDALFLDIFAGSGAVGLEALSRGAKQAIFIEQHRDALACLEANIKKLQVKEQTQVLKGDYGKMLHFLERKQTQFDIIFADAPYEMANVSETLAQFIGAYPILKKGGKLFIESLQSEPPVDPQLRLINSRNSGKAYLHQLEKL